MAGTEPTEIEWPQRRNEGTKRVWVVVLTGIASMMVALALPGRRGREVTFGARATATPTIEFERAA
jgi:hypothetical protein